MKKVRFIYKSREVMGVDMMVLEISTDGGNHWEFSKGFCLKGEMICVEAITELQRCISLGYEFVLK